MRISGIDLTSECSDDEVSEISRLIVDEHISGNFLEVGTAAGGTLVEIIKAAKKVSRDSRFFILDTFTYYENQKEKVLQNLKIHGHTEASVTLWEGTSEQYLRLQDNRSPQFQFMFIDGDHRASYVQKDLEWLNYLSVGGVVCFHDYCPRFPGVVWSVDRIFSYSSSFEVVAKCDTIIALRRVDDGVIDPKYFNKMAGIWAQARFRFAKSIRKRLTIF
jgi:hypothetical protein